MKRLALKKETLAQLGTDDLRALVGAGHESHSCAPTYKCFSGGECHSFGCVTNPDGTINTTIVPEEPTLWIGC